MKLTAAIILMISLLGCKESSSSGMTKIDTLKNTTKTAALSYLALGDSYTIGEAVAQNLCFPYQLAALIDNKGLKFENPKIIAQTGGTTDDLQSAIKSAAITSTYDIVTLLIGVNNQYRGNSIDTYRNEFKDLLQKAITFAGGNVKHVFVLSIPDWGATPFGLQSGRRQQDIGIDIDAFNAVNKEETIKAGVSYTDITPESKNAAGDPALVAADGLHPSGKMYKEWADLLAPSILKALKN